MSVDGETRLGHVFLRVNGGCRRVTAFSFRSGGRSVLSLCKVSIHWCHHPRFALPPVSGRGDGGGRSCSTRMAAFDCSWFHHFLVTFFHHFFWAKSIQLKKMVHSLWWMSWRVSQRGFNLPAMTDYSIDAVLLHWPFFRSRRCCCRSLSMHVVLCWECVFTVLGVIFVVHVMSSALYSTWNACMLGGALFVNAFELVEM